VNPEESLFTRNSASCGVGGASKSWACDIRLYIKRERERERKVGFRLCHKGMFIYIVRVVSKCKKKVSDHRAESYQDI
jgi:hypothetical protein